MIHKVFLANLLIVFVFLSCKDNFDRKLQRETAEFTRNNCPNAVEDGTYLDSVSYIPQTHTYNLYYSLNEGNEAIYKQNTHLLHDFLVKNLKNSTEYKELKDQRINFQYVYSSQTTKVLIYKTTITSNEYSR